MKAIADLLQEHHFFSELSSEELANVAGCGRNVVFEEGEVIAHRGDPATKFYLIRSGKVSLAIDLPPQKPIVFETLGVKEIVGLSWLIPPYQWTLTATAVETTRAIGIEGSCLRGKCDSDPSLGYKLMKHLVQLLLKRQEALRLYVLDVYG